MNNKELTACVKAMLLPAVLAVMGLTMVINPDSATRLMGVLMGWGILVAGGFCVYRAVRDVSRRVPMALGAVVCLLIGWRMLSNPMALAESVGRIAGVVLLLKGISDATNALTPRRKRAGRIGILIGVILLVLPLSASRVLLSMVGVGLAAVGVALGAEKIRNHRLLNTWEDSEYVSVEEDYDRHIRK